MANTYAKFNIAIYYGEAYQNHNKNLSNFSYSGYYQKELN